MGQLLGKSRQKCSLKVVQKLWSDTQRPDELTVWLGWIKSNEVCGDSFRVANESEQGTPVKFRDGPAAVSCFATAFAECQHTIASFACLMSHCPVG